MNIEKRKIIHCDDNDRKWDWHVLVGMIDRNENKKYMNIKLQLYLRTFQGIRKWSWKLYYQYEFYIQINS